MKYIVYKQPENNEYPWEINKTLYVDAGFVLASISDSNANLFDWVQWSAIEISEELANGSLWGGCIIKNGQTTRYRKWIPKNSGETVPTLVSTLAGSSSNDDVHHALKHVLSEDEVILGGEWNKFIMNRVVQEIFDSRFVGLGVSDNSLEKATYQAQLSEALAYDTDNTASTPILSVLSANRDIDVATLSTNILIANNNYNLKVAALLAEQKAIQDVIKNTVGIDDTLLLMEDLLGIMVESGLAISAGRAVDDNRVVDDSKYGIQF